MRWSSGSASTGKKSFPRWPTQVIENYPEHRRGPCCLLNGQTERGRPLHIVCTTAQPSLIIITAYEPRPPKWVTPTQRRQEP
ncbi:MAG: DUF4258 domain-containing protein [Nitrospira sp.]|nr:DUF4258 domain-containing protein [Nitrospira sp.]